MVAPESLKSADKLVYEIVSEIPKGKVMTYGQIGSMLGINPRKVGNILHQNPEPENIPCHRVVNFKGKVADSYAFGGALVQTEKLRSEGVVFIGKRVNIKKCLYKSNH